MSTASSERAAQDAMSVRRKPRFKRGNPKELVKAEIVDDLEGFISSANAFSTAATTGPYSISITGVLAGGQHLLLSTSILNKPINNQPAGNWRVM